MPNKKQKNECPICIDVITTSRKVACPYCDYVTCLSCVKRFITSSSNDASCMNCNRRFDREILLSLLPKSFVIKEYKTHRENVLMERETAMLSATQPYVEQEMQRRNNLQLLTKLNNERNELRRKIHEIDRAAREIQFQLIPPLDTTKRTFVQRCPRESCNGFLSTAWKCNVCSHYICSDCNAPKGLDRNTEHVCDPEEKKTFELIKQDSKKCPGCATYIFKIAGCDQMWCTNCHTAFSWRTGEKVNGNIHNPHFYEFQRLGGVQGRDLRDIPCGGRPQLNEIRQTFITQRQTDAYVMFNNFHRLVNHCDMVERPRFPTIIGEMNNMDLRVKYMIGEVTDMQFKHILQKREKSNQKKREIGLIFEMFINASDDLLRQAIISKDMITSNNTLQELTEYCNECFMRVSKRFECVVPIIVDFRITSRKYS